jgi:hypothetical protein
MLENAGQQALGLGILGLHHRDLQLLGLRQALDEVVNEMLKAVCGAFAWSADCRCFSLASRWLGWVGVGLGLLFRAFSRGPYSLPIPLLPAGAALIATPLPCEICALFSF